MPVREINFKVNITYGDDFLQDEAQSEHLIFLFWGIFVPIISVIGIIGNILTIIVLWRKEMKSITVYFLRTLVVTDIGIIIGTVIGLSTVAITQMNPDLWRYTDVIYPQIYTPINYIVMTLQMINVWVTVAVSVERYVAICHPFQSVKLCKKKNAFIVLIVIFVVSLFYNIPRCFATSFSSCRTEELNRDCYSIVSTNFGMGLFYAKVYFVWLYMILVYIIPLVVLIVLNTLLIIELMRMRKRRTVGNTQENSEANMSVVLILIVVVFVFCQTPGLIAQFEFLPANVMLQWMCVSNTLFVLNSSVNFLIYTAVGRKFRKTLLKMFQRFLKGGANNDFTKTSYSQNGAELTKLNSNKAITESEELSTENEKCAFRVCR